MNGHSGQNNDDFEEVIEGDTRLVVPKSRTSKGPASKKMPVFYNEAMRFARDISVLVLRRMVDTWIPKFGHFEVLDGLAGTGARGVRMANELAHMGLGDKVRLTINDLSPSSHDIIRKNIELNSVKNASQSEISLNILLSERHFDFIDIDPFGSPAPFVDSAMRAIPRRGIVGVTSTDTAALSGSYPETAARRYGGRSRRSVYMHETGARLLVGFLAREALKYDLAARPLLVHATDHYVRAYVAFERGTEKANECLGMFGYALERPDGQRWLSEKGPCEGESWSGPLWIGKLFDKGFIEGMHDYASSEKLAEGAKVRKMVALWIEEADAPGLFYDLDELASRLNSSPPGIVAVINALRERGFIATRTHFSPKGFKTNANIESIIEVFRDVG